MTIQGFSRSNMRSAQNRSMMDVCKVLTYYYYDDLTGPSPVSGYTGLTTGTCCGFAIVDVSKAPPYPTPPLDAQIRLPAGTSVTTNDRIQMTTRNGSTVSETYEIVGPLLDGPTATRLNLRRIPGV